MKSALMICALATVMSVAFSPPSRGDTPTNEQVNFAPTPSRVFAYEAPVTPMQVLYLKADHFDIAGYETAVLMVTPSEASKPVAARSTFPVNDVDHLCFCPFDHGLISTGNTSIKDAEHVNYQPFDHGLTRQATI